MTRRRRAKEMATALDKARELSREERVVDWTEEEWRALMTAAVSQELERRPAPGKVFPSPLLAYGSAALLLVAAVGIALRLGVFRPGLPVVPVEAPAPVLAQKSVAAPPPANQARAREKEAVLAESSSSPRKAEAFVVGGVMAPAAARLEAKDESRRPAGSDQDAITIRLVSPASGLRIVWVLDRNFEWEGETR